MKSSIKRTFDEVEDDTIQVNNEDISVKLMNDHTYNEPIDTALKNYTDLQDTMSEKIKKIRLL